MNQAPLPPEVMWVALGIGGVCGLTIGTTILFFFIRTLSRTQREVSNPNRDISTRALWWSILLNQIPLVGSFWEIYIVLKLSSSLRNEFVERGWNTKIESFGRTVGLLWAVGGLLYAPIAGVQLYFFLNGDMSTAVMLSAIETPVSMVVLVCFIMFWIQMYQYGARFREATRSDTVEEDYDDRKPRRDRDEFDRYEGKGDRR